MEEVFQYENETHFQNENEDSININDENGIFREEKSEFINEAKVDSESFKEMEVSRTSQNRSKI